MESGRETQDEDMMPGLQQFDETMRDSSAYGRMVSGGPRDFAANFPRYDECQISLAKDASNA